MCISMPKTGTAAYLIVLKCSRVRAHFKLTPCQYRFMADHVQKIFRARAIKDECYPIKEQLMHSDSSSATESCICSRIHSDESWGTDIKTSNVEICRLFVKQIRLKFNRNFQVSSCLESVGFVPKQIHLFTLRWECEVSYS